LWAAFALCVAGAVLGAALSAMAVGDLSARASKLAGFERAWSEAVGVDRMASEAASDFARHGDEGELDRFKRLVGPREQALAAAIEIAPKGGASDTLAEVYSSARAMESLESAAVAMAQGGQSQGAGAILSGREYAIEGSRKTRLLSKAKRELGSALEREVQLAFLKIGSALTLLLAFMLAAAVCWARVAMMARKQAEELAEARDALEVHAATLERRIAERTADLEAAKVAAEAADQAKSAFLAQMSHEIRTPLNGVLGMAEAMAASPLDERQQRMLKVIRDSGDTLLTLLNDVLDLAKVEAGQMTLERVSFSLMDIARSVESMFTHKAHEKGVSFAVSAEEGADVWCLGDPTRVRQVLCNLVSNAVKFTEQGAVGVTLRAVPLDNGEREVRFDVVDTGVGLSPSAVERLFNRFVQADLSTTRRFGGTGLGLAICKELAELMGGAVTVESAPGRGSTFSFVFRAPLSSPPERTDAATLESALVDMGEPAGVRILAAEDNSHNRMVLQMFLAQLGIEPVFAENGAIAVEQWRAQAFDLILMDVQMPLLSGPDATREIRRLEALEGRPRTPIIALTANAMTHHVAECLQAGMDSHVAKPIRPEILYAAIEKALNLDAAPALSEAG
jgi:signal transduction histidine kinase/CheY-like chemotaxis protein